ncbi:MAG: TetR/AcrR family transcriptional regulator, partial [Chloroflexota bacterium]
GYENASINVILSAAGMSKGQFYYHFKNKEALYLALIGVLIDRKQVFLASVMQPEDFQQDIFTILEVQIRYGLAFAQEYPKINQFAESFIKEKGTPIYQSALAAHNFQDNTAMDQLVAAAHARGEFRADLPQSFIRRAIGHLLTNAVDIADLDAAADSEAKLKHLIAFMRAGLGRGDES